MTIASVRLSLFALMLCLLFALRPGTAQAQEYTCSISPLSEATKREMLGRAWNEDCPVPLEDLALLELKYWGIDGTVHSGEIVVHKLLAKEVADIFRELFALRFPMDKVRTYENYSVGKYAIHNATVGFYCRKAQDAPTEWSSHAYGLALDINPLINPFLDPEEGWWPKGSEQYSERDGQKGKIVLQSEVFNVFAKYGWRWGGLDHNPDYMHFQKGIFGSKDRPMSTWYFAPALRYGAP